MSHTGDEDAEGGHLVGLDQLVLMALQLFKGPLALGDFLGQFLGALRDPALQGARPDDGAGQDQEQGDKHHGAVLATPFPRQNVAARAPRAIGRRWPGTGRSS